MGRLQTHRLFTVEEVILYVILATTQFTMLVRARMRNSVTQLLMMVIH